jgi:hydroxypyruvate isomerase
MKPQKISRLVSVHLDYILGDLELSKRFPTARALGFNAVEFPFPYQVPASLYRSLLDDNGLAQISIGAPAANYKSGQPGYSMVASLRDDFDRSLDVALAYAHEIGCKNIHIFAGGRPQGVEEKRIFDTYCSNIDRARNAFKAEGFRLVIEAINSTDFSGYYMDRLDRFLAVAQTIGSEGIGLILDFYHAHMNGEDARCFLTSHTDLVAHIQLADFPGRHEPGSGNIDFDTVFKAIDAADYSGSIGLEYIPTRPIGRGVPLAKHLFDAK